MKILISTITLILSSILSLSAQTGTWSGQLEVQGSKLTLVFHLDDDAPTVDSPDQGVRGVPAQLERGVAGITIKVPMIGASYNGVWLGKQIVGTFKQSGLSLPLTLTPGEEKLNRPQTPKGPFAYATEEVEFANGDAILRGTLTLPQGYNRSTPVVILVSGSGIQNRDEEIFEHKPFAVIADALANAGIASLRYDDRGAGASVGDVINATTEDFKNDALAGIKLLRERFNNVGVIGHSEGGTIALMLASEQEVDFVVSLAGMVLSGAETLVQQNRDVLTTSGLPSHSIDEYCKLISKAFDVRIHGGVMPNADDYDIPQSLKQNYLAVLDQIQSPYMLHLLSLDVRPELADITCPVLALNGNKDVQVNAKSNLAALIDGLPKNSSNIIEEVQDLNHLFQHCTTGAVEEYRSIEETISPEVLEKMVLWISKLY